MRQQSHQVVIYNKPNSQPCDVNAKGGVGAGYLSSEGDQSLQPEQDLQAIFENQNNYALRESINSTSTLGGRHEEQGVLADRTNMVINPQK